MSENAIGISSACFYPDPTERSFEKLCSTGTSCAELFINSFSELSPAFLAPLREMQLKHGIDVVSLHPFMSFAEGYFLFSEYRRRYDDILPAYEAMFRAMQLFGAKYFVMHGIRDSCKMPEDLFFEMYRAFVRHGREFGVEVCTENVHRYRSGDPAFLCRMAEAIGDDFSMVLDIKQAYRTGHSPADFITPLSAHIRHVHISDRTPEKDCILPPDGMFDFRSFFQSMRAVGYTGAYIIEVYRDSITDETSLARSYENTKKILHST